MRLHSCYFSRQNLETTVVNQGMLKKLFKGILPLGNLKNDISISDYMQPFSKCQICMYHACIYSGHCKVLATNRKPGVRESHYSFIEWNKCLPRHKAVIH